MGFFLFFSQGRKSFIHTERKGVPGKRRNAPERMNAIGNKGIAWQKAKANPLALAPEVFCYGISDADRIKFVFDEVVGSAE